MLPGSSPEIRLARARDLAKAGHIADALAIWQPLAEAGIARAQTNLGACYATGNGVPADSAAARSWLQRGAEGGDALGQRNLATLSMATDPTGAAEWYRRAAEQGDAVSQDELSRILFEAGHNLPEARRWAEQAALQGMPAAAHRFATLCHEAKGGPRDPAQAAHWWRVAAAAGNPDAAAMLGAVLHMGQGVAADQVEAMAWLLVASAGHSALVRPFFTRVEAGLTETELARARVRAAGKAPSDRTIDTKP